jgi:alpha-mannosidase
MEKAFQIARIEPSHVVLDCIKLAEPPIPNAKDFQASGNDVILRCFEAMGGRASQVNIQLWKPIASVLSVNILEQPVHDPALGPTDLKLTSVNNTGISFGIRPFQVVTLRVTFK